MYSGIQLELIPDYFPFQYSLVNPLYSECSQLAGDFIQNKNYESGEKAVGLFKDALDISKEIWKANPDKLMLTPNFVSLVEVVKHINIYCNAIRCPD